MEISTDFLKIRHPATVIVSGPTFSGKSTLVRKLVENIDSMFLPVPEIIFFCYTEFQNSYMEIKTTVPIHLHEGTPDMAELKKHSGKRILLILDDMMADIKKSNLNKLFVKFSHHNNCSLMHIVQNLFFEGLRTARVNAHYLLVTKNPSDKLQIQTLARQLFPKKQQFLVEAYEDATREPFGYLLIDTHQLTPENLRIRTNILPGDVNTV